jgi:pimeloyl-ACP methyl ester carboxylesterase
VRPGPCVREGFVPFGGLRMWHRLAGETEQEGRQPLVLVHGGPGFSHDCLEPLARLARRRQVVFCDHLGCGRSDHLHDPSLWSVELLEESSYAPHLEEPERFLAAVDGFLRKVEEGAA